MEEWKKYKIGDLCSISSSKRIFAKEYQSSGVPFLEGKKLLKNRKGRVFLRNFIFQGQDMTKLKSNMEFQKKVICS